MTDSEKFKKELEQKLEKSLKEEKHYKGLIINDDNQDWGGCHQKYVKQELV